MTLSVDLGHIPEKIKECQNLQVANFSSNPLQLWVGLCNSLAVKLNSCIVCSKTCDWDIIQVAALTGCNTTGPPSRAAACWVTLHMLRHGVLQTTTDDYDRCQTAKHYWPPTLCAGGPVVTFLIHTNLPSSMSTVYWEHLAWFRVTSLQRLFLHLCFIDCLTGPR